MFKRLDSRYEPGRRSGAWLKVKHRRTERFHVTRWTAARADSDEMDLFYVGQTTDDGASAPVGGVSSTSPAPVAGSFAQISSVGRPVAAGSATSLPTSTSTSRFTTRQAQRPAARRGRQAIIVDGESLPA